MSLQLPFWGKLVRSSTRISGKEYTRRISNPLARQNVTAVHGGKLTNLSFGDFVYCGDGESFFSQLSVGLASNINVCYEAPCD